MIRLTCRPHSILFLLILGKSLCEGENLQPKKNNCENSSVLSLLLKMGFVVVESF